MSDAPNLFFPLIATSAAVAVGGLALLQTDKVSRMILDPVQLNTKRRGEYRYNWKKSGDKVKLQLDYFFAGGPQKYDDDPEIVMKNTEYVSKENDLNALVQKIVDKKATTSTFYTLKIDKDPHDPTEEFYLYIVQEQQSSNDRVLFQVPLIKFGMKLAQAFEDQLTTTTLCFVADASAGKATNMLESLVKESKAGVAVVSEPFWMVQIAKLAEASIVASSKIRKLVFALCRLDAWSVRQEVGDAKTVMFTLPGQAVVATLLPLVQSAFPEERHVFAYDGCVASVKRGVYAELVHNKSELFTNLEPIIRGMCKDPVRVTTPLPSNSPLSHDISLGGSGGALERSLAQVPLQQARNVETWISSVDAYFKLKNEEANNGYLPYCFKLAFLTDDPVGNFEYGTDSYWSLHSFMQYVTGCQGRAMQEGVIDAAKEWIKDYNLALAAEQTTIEKSVTLSEHERNMIENCCFQHKQILIGNKTLQDTVLPKEHWTMKQASRNGCSCCGPDPYDQMEEEEDDAESDKVMTSSFGLGKINVTIGANGSSTNSVPSKSRGYVDATQVFAFDPTRFS
jgi:hypothetical protein